MNVLKLCITAIGLYFMCGMIFPGHVNAGSYEDFFEALAHDDVNQITTLLNKGFDPNTVDAKGIPALSVAIQSNATQSMNILLRTKDIDINTVDGLGETALMQAAIKGNTQWVDMLLNKSAQPNKQGWTALHYAAAGGFLDIVKKLLAANAYIDALSPNGTTPLMMASRAAAEDVATYLLEEGADPTLVNQSGFDATAYALQAGKKQLASQLSLASENFKNKYYGFKKIRE